MWHLFFSIHFLRKGISMLSEFFFSIIWCIDSYNCMLKPLIFSLTIEKGKLCVLMNLIKHLQTLTNTFNIHIDATCPAILAEIMKPHTNQAVPIKDLTVWLLEIIWLNVPRRVLHTSEDVIYSWGAVNPRLIFGTWAEQTVIFN